MRMLEQDETDTEPVDVTKIRDGLIRVPLRTATLPPATHTHSYLVQHVGRLGVVDVGGFGDRASIAPLLDVIGEQGEGDLHGVFITHEHPDHHAGLHALIEAFPSLTVYAHAHVIARIAAAYPTVTWMDVKDGDTWMGFEVMLTEGHAKGHLSLIGPDVVICGDMMAGLGTIVVAPPDGDMSAYMTSLERLATRGGDRWCLPAHGGAAASIRTRAQFYLAHRRAREEKIFDALQRGGALSLHDLTVRAYDDVPTSLHAFAERSALAHLIKLEQDGRASYAQAAWRAVEDAP